MKSLDDGRWAASPSRALRGRWLVAFLVLFSLSCRLSSQVPAAMISPVAEPTATHTFVPPATPRPVATFTPTPLPSPTAAASVDQPLRREGVSLFPWPLYGGDRLSVSVEPLLSDVLLSEARGRPTVVLDLDGGASFSSNVTVSGLSGLPQARFNWVADVPTTTATLGLTLTLQVAPDDADGLPGIDPLHLTVPVLPREMLPAAELGATWALTESEGLALHYLTGSAAERDLVSIVLEARAAYTDVSARLGGAEAPVTIYLLDRVIGQGGYASADWVAISYVDRMYAPTSLASVLRHELTHRLDGAIGCDGAPAMVREGLAVYLSGGHYRPEPLRQKARALLATPRYIPLRALVESFYTHQHEIAYLEAGALVQYIVERFGWEALPGLCAAASASAGSDPDLWMAAVEALGVVDPSTFEQDWLAWLWGGAKDDARRAELLQLELRLMEAMRAYQETYDPTAHFLRGILFSPSEAASLDIVADFVRRPREAIPIGFELVLAMAQEALGHQDAAMLEMLVDDLVVAYAGGPSAAAFVKDAVDIAALALDRGWEPAHLALEGDGSCRVWAIDRGVWPQQLVYSAQKENGRWDIGGQWLGD